MGLPRSPGPFATDRGLASPAAIRNRPRPPTEWADGMALPVTVSGPDHVATQVSAWVESRLGWQVTDGGALPPMVRLVAPDGAEATACDDTIPSIALVGPDDDPMAAAALASTCDGVLAWPADHDDLPAVVAQCIAVGPRRRNGSTPSVGLADIGGRDPARAATASNLHRHGDAGRAATIVVGGCCGGVGTSTIAITVAAWQVWGSHGGRAMAVVSGPAPVPDLRTVDAEVLAGHRGWAAATPVPGVDGLRVVRRRGPLVRLAAPDGVATVVDVGVVGPTEEEVDVLVVRRDAAGLAALRDSPCGSVAVADDGPVPRRRMLEAADGRRVVMIPWSLRVARAHALQRLPGSAPGSYAAAVGALVVEGHHRVRPSHDNG